MLSATERIVLFAALALATAAAWAVTWTQTAAIPALDPFLAQALCGGEWTAAGVASALVMWIAMMVAMMLPATAPTVEAFATIARRRRARHQPYTPALVFVTGYLLVWAGFSVAATLVQWLLYRAALITPTAQNTSPALAGVTLLMAGFYQFTSLKAACLRGCRSPLTFIMAHWREGHAGALFMGVRHGAACVGCCWALMSLMVCVAVMDLRWAAALAVYAAAERLMPGGDTILAPAFGAAAVLGGAALLGYSLI